MWNPKDSPEAPKLNNSGIREQPSGALMSVSSRSIASVTPAQRRLNSEVPFSFSMLLYTESMLTHAQVNDLTQAFSIKSFKDHKELLRKSVSLAPESLLSLFPADLVKSASNFGFESQKTLNVGLIQNVAATMIQSVWRSFLARALTKLYRHQRNEQLDKVHEENLFTVHLIVAQTAARRYLANRLVRKLKKAVQKVTGLIRQPAAHHQHQQADAIGVITAADLPPNSAFDENGNRRGGEHTDGALMEHCAASLIQQQVRKRVLARFARARTEIRRRSEASGEGRASPYLRQRQMSAAESVANVVRLLDRVPSSASTPDGSRAGRVPAPPPMEKIQGLLSRNSSSVGFRVGSPLGGSCRLLSQTGTASGGQALAAVFWDAAGLLLDPKRNAFQSNTAHLWGLRVLHDVMMMKRRDNPEWMPKLPLTIWVQGPLESEAQKERNRRAEATSFAASPATPRGNFPISRSITPRSKVRPTGSAAARRLSPLGRSPRALLNSTR